jgi:hypothetical protein
LTKRQEHIVQTDGRILEDRRTTENLKKGNIIMGIRRAKF